MQQILADQIKAALAPTPSPSPQNPSPQIGFVLSTPQIQTPRRIPNFVANPTLLYFWVMTLANVARHHHHIHAIPRRALS